MRSEISHVHPEIRTQIPDEIIDCNQVSFSAPLRIITRIIIKNSKKIWRFKNNAYLCNPKRKSSFGFQRKMRK